jgi:hypothetical protein
LYTFPYFLAFKDLPGGLASYLWSHRQSVPVAWAKIAK